MSLWLTTKRVARYGFVGFLRNGFVSLAAVSIMTITLFVVAALLMSDAALQAVLQDLSGKVDVTAYLLTGTTDAQAAQLQQSLQALPQVQSVTYVTSDQALAAFEQRHAGDQLTMQALQELGDNPLDPSLEIEAKDPSQYAAIAQYLDSQQSAGTGVGAIIDKVDYSQNQTAIERLDSIIQTSRKLGLAIAIIFGLASLLIAFNTIRLAIYTARDEIGVMNLVGASHWYVRGPFMIAGVLYGITSAVIVLLILYPLSAWLGPPSQSFLGNFDVYTYYVHDFWFLLVVILGAGIALGALSSYLAVRRYLRA